MKRALLSGLFAGTMLLGAAIHSHAADSATTQPAVDPTPVNMLCAVQGTDPIDPQITTIYKGKTFAFCCKDCIAEFKKNPEKYAATAK